MPGQAQGRIQSFMMGRGWSILVIQLLKQVDRPYPLSFSPFPNRRFRQFLSRDVRFIARGSVLDRKRFRVFGLLYEKWV